MKIGIISKKNPADISAKNRVMAAIEADGEFEVVELASAMDITSDFDKVLAFGGDGTVLDAVRGSVKYGIPVLGVNLGNLGFLTKFEATAEASKVIKALKSGKTEKRMLLKIEAGGEKYYALNDVVIKSNTTLPIHVTLKINGEYVDKYHSDGVIVSSPTGSTAYSLSAGGPVLSPDVDGVVVNPICAHSLHSRPLVISAKSEIFLGLRDDENADIVIDGKLEKTLSRFNGVKITKSEEHAVFVKTNESNFYKKLLDKMNSWGVTEQ